MITTQGTFHPGDRVRLTRKNGETVPATVIALRDMKKSGKRYYSVHPDDSGQEESGVTPDQLS